MKNRKIPPSYYEDIKEKISWCDVLLKLGIKFKKTVEKGSAGSGRGIIDVNVFFIKKKPLHWHFLRTRCNFIAGVVGSMVIFFNLFLGICLETIITI